MWHGIGYNIINITNQLFFIFQSLALELQVFALSLTESIRVANFIYTLEEKQKA